MRIDIGSGYNPKTGFKTCDTNFNCDYYSISEIPNNSCNIIRLRNVIHHIKHFNTFINELKRIINYSGYLLIIECRKENFNVNVLLDTIWYRSVNNRSDIYIRTKYFDYEQHLKDAGFILKAIKYNNEKEIKIFSFNKF